MAAAKAITTAVQLASRSARVIGQPRLLVHGLVLTLVAGSVAAGTIDTSSEAAVSLLAKGAGYGSTLDQAAAVNVAAKVAEKTDFLAASTVGEQASTLNSQIDLPVAAEATLAKRQVVDTAGADRRTVRSYTVEGGDTLSGIAAKFGITTSTLKWANDLSDADEIKPGQELTILPVSGVLHTVAAGETAESLAQKYQANAAQITSFNNAEIKGLAVGQQIVIPDGVIKEVSRPAARPAQVAASQPAPSRLTAFYGNGNSYSYGYCTYYVASRRAVPSNWGNAASWYYNAQFSGFSVGTTPVPGAIAWTPYGYYGHVAYVENVSGGMVTVSDMNYNGNWNRVTTRTVPASSFRYIY